MTMTNPTPPPGHLKRILVVDDDPLTVKILNERLKANNYDVVTAVDAAEGLQLAMSAQPHVIILDVMMPVINGYNFCRLLKSQDKFKRIPIIMVTSRAEEEDKAIGEEVGADAYITKPFKMEDILSHVKSFLKE